MKFYNPFKPHLCKFGNGLYGVRKLTFFGWEYFDQDSIIPLHHWWLPYKYVVKYCMTTIDKVRWPIKSERVKE